MPSSRSSSPAMQRMLALMALSLLLNGGVHGQVVPAVISFGDSTIDVGNNNYLPGAVFKANYAPYGENFRRHRATGRFSDGKIVTDITASRATRRRTSARWRRGRTSSPAPTSAPPRPATPTTRRPCMDAITLSQQLKYYKEYRSKLAAVAGRRQARTILAEALYVVSTGTGDFIQNYYHNASLSARYDVDRYCDLLVGIFSGFADELYRLGARRIGVTTMPPLGCLPATIRLYGKGRSRTGCLPRLNRDAETFNRKLNATVGALVRRHAGLKVAVFDVYTPLRDLSERPAAQGFAEARRTCCRTGNAGTRVYLCDPATAARMCRNASSYVYFDGVHPSEAANLVIAESLVSAGIDLLT
ncbi:unnamed protein product [Triticum turgidum subsp. durum]|uniref:GDSL esterase/lipase APG n=1 Tax=Triticum turgidum subsp. durum TaxID=4567 RepID=A0A9R0SSF2_TRITD|nr:unnamed protein product [Triticum turgidum subsp. durum]